MTLPVEETEEGYYPVSEPLSGDRPDSISLTYGETTYVLEGFVGTRNRSRFQPDVLLYETCTVEGPD